MHMFATWAQLGSRMTWGIKSPGLHDSRRHLAPLNKIARACSVHCVCHAPHHRAGCTLISPLPVARRDRGEGLTGHPSTEDIWDCLDTSHSAGQLGERDQQEVLDTNARRPCPAAGTGHMGPIEVRAGTHMFATWAQLGSRMTWGIKSPGLPDSRRHLAPLDKIARARSVHCVVMLHTVGLGVP